MGEQILKVLLQNKMGNMSLRDTAKQIGVSHTTISRILNDETTPDINTFLAICEWLDVSPSYVLSAYAGGATATAESIAAIVEQYPDLGDVLEEASDLIEKGEIPSHIMQDVIGYMKYRLGTVPA